jgi:hypothetical protein
MVEVFAARLAEAMGRVTERAGRDFGELELSGDGTPSFGCGSLDSAVPATRHPRVAASDVTSQFPSPHAMKRPLSRLDQ